MLCILVLCLLHIEAVSASPAFSIHNSTGAGLCQLFAAKGAVPWDCKDPLCHWDTWKDVKAKSNKIVLSYSHNGFGNQLWEHSFGFAVAGALEAKFMVGKIPPSLFIGGYMPPNTDAAFELVTHLLPDEFEFDTLPANSPERKLCENEPLFIGDRPFDLRRGSLSKERFANVTELLNDPNPRCLKLVGYFQQSVFCDEDVRALWGLKNIPEQVSLINVTDFGVLQHHPHAHGHGHGHAHGHTSIGISGHTSAAEVPVPVQVVDTAVDGKIAEVAKLLNQTELLSLLGNRNLQLSLHDLVAGQNFPRPGDICIYLRCLPSHYQFNSRLFYEIILNRTAWSRIMVFEAPPCCCKGGVVKEVRDFLYNELNATK